MADAYNSDSQWHQRIVGHDTVAPDSLLANPLNFRIHSKLQQDAIAGLLSEVGWVKSVVVNQATGHIVDGHARVTLALRNNSPVPVEYVELSEAEERLVLASLDNIVGMAGTDKAQLDALLHDVATSDEALMGMLSEMAQDAGLYFGDPPPEGGDAEPQIDRAEELREKWGVETGQLWRMPSRTEGQEHRIICGDCTDAEVVERVMDIDCRLMVTDPPYGVEYDQEWRSSNRTGKVKNDDKHDWRTAYALFRGDVIYCWHAYWHASSVQDGLEDCGFDLRAQIIWNKPRLVFSMGHYHWKHEPCHYAVKRGAGALWIGDRKQSTVWDIAADADVEGGHSTQKPVECMARPIRNHKGDVYEPFSGSGTTIIAAENLQRQCRAVEISPAYVAVALQRYQDAFGITPELVTD